MIKIPYTCIKGHSEALTIHIQYNNKLLLIYSQTSQKIYQPHPTQYILSEQDTDLILSITTTNYLAHACSWSLFSVQINTP